VPLPHLLSARSRSSPDARPPPSQFVTAPSPSTSSSSSPAPLAPPPSSLTFLSTAPSDSSPRFAASDAPPARSGDVVALDAFVAASENGVLFAPGETGQVRVCAIEGASVRAEEQ